MREFQRLDTDLNKNSESMAIVTRFQLKDHSWPATTRVEESKNSDFEEAGASMYNIVSKLNVFMSMF